MHDVPVTCVGSASQSVLQRELASATLWLCCREQTNICKVVEKPSWSTAAGAAESEDGQAWICWSHAGELRVPQHVDSPVYSQPSCVCLKRVTLNSIPCFAVKCLQNHSKVPVDIVSSWAQSRACLHCWKMQIHSILLWQTFIISQLRLQEGNVQPIISKAST